MKRQFVTSLQEGDPVNDYFLAARKDLREQANGGTFLGMVFKDRTGEIGDEIAARQSRVRKIRHASPRGVGASFGSGVASNVRRSATSMWRETGPVTSSRSACRGLATKRMPSAPYT